MDQSRPTPTFFDPTWDGWYTFPIFDMWIRSGDIRDQSRKLSEIAQNFGRFFGPTKFFWGQAFQKLYPVYHAARRLKKFHEDTPTSPEVIGPNTLNFRFNFKFSPLIFFFGGGTLVPLGGMR